MNSKEYYKEYYECNKDKISKYYKEYYECNRDKILKNKKEYYERNKDKILKKLKAKCYQRRKAVHICEICKLPYPTDEMRKNNICYLCKQEGR